jgi:dCMP deaminase
MNKVKARQYMEIAYATARLSKDSSTQVGAVIVGPTNEVRSLGYNGAPRGCSADDGQDQRGLLRPEKYFWYSHAELNAITNAARVGTPLDGSTIVVTHPPCMDCARAIVQAGIKEVVAVQPTAEFTDRWTDHIRRTKALFQECGVTYTEIENQAKE